MPRISPRSSRLLRSGALHSSHMPSKTARPSRVERLPDQRLFWDQWHRDHSVASHTVHAEAAVSEFVGALPSSNNCRKVLELGCGQGREAVNMAGHGLDVSGIDHSTVAIERANALAGNLGLDLDFRRHDLSTRLPYDSGTFSGVFAHLSLHYFDDATTARLFNEIARVLRPQGVLYFTVRSVRDPLYGQGDQIGKDRYCIKGHVRHFFREEYVREVLATWHIQFTEYYRNSNCVINPGVFLRTLANTQ